MVTATIVLWLIFGGVCLALALMGGDELGCIVFLVLGLLSLIISFCIYWDARGSLPVRSLHEITVWLLIAALVAIGIPSLLGFFGALIAAIFWSVRNQEGPPSHGYEPRQPIYTNWRARSLVAVLVSSIGLLASVLGIVSFYLDHLR